jgi:phage gp45-like
MIRGIIKTVLEGVIKRFSADGRSDESFENREYFQHYGFTSRPKPGAEIIIIREGNAIIAIASDDRRYRLQIEEGEVALYTDEGDKVHLKRGRVVEIETETLLVKAGTKVRFETPLIESTGQVKADLDITDNVTTTGRSMAGMREIHKIHNHPEHDGGNTGVPNQEM